MDSVTICNMALRALGIRPITSFDDNSNQAQDCKSLFPVLRDRVLRDHLWSFATTGYDLSALTEESFDPEFSHTCALPTDFIRLVRLTDDQDYRMLGKNILVRSLPAKLIYIRRVNDPNNFDPTFTEALQYLLMAEMAMQNTRDVNLVNLYRVEYEKRLSTARSIDSQENVVSFQRRRNRSSYIQSRRSGGTSEHVPVRFTEGDSGAQK